MVCAICGDALAQTAASAKDDESINEVIVTGTRRTDRTVAESVTPIDVISQETFQTIASTDTNNVLMNLVPSYNVQRLGIADGSTYVRPPTMRGLPPDQILVLVNGKRFHRAALVQLVNTQVTPMAVGAQGVDLAVIPTSSIGRLEILRDGASAQYGSDAIAGVMNFILNTNSQGLRTSVRYGQFTKGDGEDTQVTANLGLPLGSTGFFNLSGEYVDSQATNRGVMSPVGLAILDAHPELIGKISSPERPSGNPAERSLKFFANAGIKLDNGGEVYAFGDYVQTRKTSVFNWRVPYSAANPDFIPGTNCGTTGTPATCSEAAYTNSALRTATFGAAGVFAPIYLDKIPGAFTSTGAPIWNANGRTFSFLSVFPGGFVPQFGADIRDASIVGGYKGELANGLTYDFSGTYGMNRISYFMHNSVNGSMGPDSPTDFKPGTLEQRESAANIDVTYPLQLPSIAKPVTLSAGLEYHQERYLIGLGDYASYTAGQYGAQVISSDGGATTRTITQAPGSQGFGGFSPAVVTDRQRSSKSIYVGAEGDITDKFQLAVMGRFDDFTDVGSTATGKIAARFEFVPEFAVRGAVSTGFRAATPGQQGTYALSTSFRDPNQPLSPVISGTYAVDSVNAQYFGAKPLKPEKSVNLTAGFVWQPLARTTVSLDYYNIDVKDRISLSPTFEVRTTGFSPAANRSVLPSGCTATNDRQALTCLGDPNAQFLYGVNYFANLFDTRTQGLDLVVSNGINSSFGRWNTTLAANYNQTRVTKPNQYDFNGADKIAIEESQPKYKFNLTENWVIGRFSTTARLSWFGAWKSVPSSGNTPINSSTTVPTFPQNPGNPIYNPILDYPAQYTIDLDVAYEVTDKIRASVGAENILDEYPPLSKTGIFPRTGTSSFGTYYAGAPISSNGTFWYVRLSAQF
ncbi:MAG: TonB-dependent receptor [Steroidobacteraceae bacterium]